MLYIIFIFILIAIIIKIKKNHLHIKFKTFLKKGFLPERGVFGIYCYCGKQGSGKTYSVVEHLINSDYDEIYANLESLKGIDYTYFKGLDELLELRSKSNCIIVFDEIFTILSKLQKTNPRKAQEIMDFLSQMRKRKIIFITTCQEWLELPMTFRRYCRFQIDCKMLSYRFINLGILVKRFYDAENMKWSTLDNEYVAPILDTTISKTILSVANSYDTFEQIKV